MATIHPRFADQCLELRKVASRLKQLRWDMEKLVGHHNANGFSTVNDPTPPAWLRESADLNIDGVDFDTADYLNGISMLQQLENFFGNAAVTQGDYATTMGKVAQAS